jgi:hypothetical protein
MNTPVENPRHPAKAVGVRWKVTGCARRTFQFSLNQNSPAPLWQQARIRTGGFRRADLERENWEKVWHSMLEV